MTSGATINARVTLWSDRREPAALDLACHGGSVGGVEFSPVWALLTAALSFAVAAMVVIWPLTGRYFGPPPALLGLDPDSAVAPPAPRPQRPSAGPLWWLPAFHGLSLAFAPGLTARMGMLITRSSMLALSLYTLGATLVMSLATAGAIIGRTAVGMLLLPALDRRRIGVLSFMLQALGCTIPALAAGG